MRYSKCQRGLGTPRDKPTSPNYATMFVECSVRVVYKISCGRVYVDTSGGVSTTGLENVSALYMRLCAATLSSIDACLVQFSWSRFGDVRAVARQ